MTKQTYRIWLRISIAVILITSFLLPDTLTVQASTEIGGPIISNTVWTTANSPYIVVTNVEVWEGVTLIIEPGVTVRFDSGSKMQVNGELIAKGTASAPIAFTSNQTVPAPGDWGNLEFTGTATIMDVEGNYVSGSILQHCVVEYAGASVANAIDAHSLLIDHCIVQNNAARGIWNESTGVTPARVTNTTVTNNSTDGQGGGLYVGAYSAVLSNVISNNSADCRGGGIYAGWYSTIVSNTISGNTAKGIGGGVYTGRYSTIFSNTIRSNTADWGGGIVADDYSQVMGNTISGNSANGPGGGIFAGSHSTVRTNLVIGNAAESSGGGIYVNDYSIVNGNIVTGNSAKGDGGGICTGYGSTVSENIIDSNLNTGKFGRGGGIYAATSTVYTNTITSNQVTGVNSQGAGATIAGGSFLYNTVVGNSGPSGSTAGGVELISTPQVHYNNFYGNAPYDVTILLSHNISGTNNYWGTVSSVDILNQVYDWYDNTDRGKFLYVPYLQEPSPDAPFPPPVGLTADFQDSSITLSWDAHPSFTTGWGYKTYYDTDEALPPYEGLGLNEGDSPIDVGDQTTYTLTGLDFNKDYYFTVTTYDNKGHESWYSNLVQKQGGYWIYLPAILR